MKLVKSTATSVYSTELTWELAPCRRTLLSVRDGILFRWSRRYFVPLPWTYMVVKTYERPDFDAAGPGRPPGKKLRASGLSVGFRPSPFSPGDPIYYFQMANSYSGAVCLGDPLLMGIDYDAIDDLVQEITMAYFSTAFINSQILIPQIGGGAIKNFKQWSRFKHYQEMNINWEACPSL